MQLTGKTTIVAFFTVLLLTSPLRAQVDAGLGIEAGAGYNQFYPHDVSFGSYTHFSLQPTLRLSYKLPVRKLMSAVPFVGYSRFGGRTATGEGGAALWLSSLETGMHLMREAEHVQLGVAAKANRHLGLAGRMLLPAAGTWHPADALAVTPWSLDVGLRLGAEVSQLLVGLETWFGFTSVAVRSASTAEKAFGRSGEAADRFYDAQRRVLEAMNTMLTTFHQNHFRLLLGWRF